MSKRKPPHTVWEDIDPETAKQYLLLNKANRPLKPTKIAEWAVEMKAGKWHETHQGIAFDWDGNLIDGQNRLSALVESGTTQRMPVTYNLDPASFSAIDDGVARSGSDLFSVSFLRHYGERPADPHRVASVAHMMDKGLSSGNPSKEDTALYAMKHYKLIREFIRVAAAPESGTTVCAAFCNAALYFGRARIEPLVERYATQMWASTTDPLKVLHQRLVRAKIMDAKRDAMSKVDKYAVTVSAIRHALQGATHGKLMAATRDFGTDDDKKMRRDGAAGAA